MRNLKKFLALVLAMMMTFSLMVTVNAANTDFTDSKDVNAKFTEAVDVLSGMGVFQGTDEDGKLEFKPQSDVTRAQMAAVVYRLATGDAKDEHTHLYKDFANFSDVSGDAWYAGYVGYCADAEIVIGPGDGTFHPAEKVTGYQALAMLLRAVGYGKNKEFEGANWKINVGSTATGEGLLKNVNTTSYATTLDKVATREMLAEISFQAAQIPTVQYQYGHYNKYDTTVTVSSFQNNYNPSLGLKHYGLTCHYGIVLGNTATGEDGITKIGFAYDGAKDAISDVVTDKAYIYNTTSVDTDHVTLAFTGDQAQTGLRDFGHKVKVWYDCRGDGKSTVTVDTNVNFNNNVPTYAMYDEVGKTAVVSLPTVDLTTPANGGSIDLAVEAIEDAGFKLCTDQKTYWNYSFGPMATGNRLDGSSNNADNFISPIKKNNTSTPAPYYVLISNNTESTNSLDMVITLDLTVTQISQVNNNKTPKDVAVNVGDTGTAADIYVNGKAHGDELIAISSNSQRLRVAQAALTDGSAKALGDNVVAMEITGTAGKSVLVTNGTANTGNLPNGSKLTSNTSDYYYNLAKLGSDDAHIKTGSVWKVDTATNKVWLSDGTELERSWLADTVANNRILDLAATSVSNIAANVARTVAPRATGNYTFTLDDNGDYIFWDVETTQDKFVYGTYLDWESQTASSSFRYPLVGVGLDGQQTIDNVKTVENGSTALNALNYDSSVLPRRDKENAGLGSSSLKKGKYVGVMINSQGTMTAVTAADVVKPGNSSVFNADITIDSDSLTMGAELVYLDGPTKTGIYLTEETQFYIVDGAGTDNQKVESYKGLSALMEGNTSVVIKGNTAFGGGDYLDADGTPYDMICYTSSPMNHAQDYATTALQVDTVYIPKAIMTFNERVDSNLFFVGTDSSTLVDVSADATQFTMYDSNGDEHSIWLKGIDNGASNNYATSADAILDILSDADGNGSTGDKGGNFFVSLKPTSSTASDGSVIYDIVPVTGTVTDKVVGKYVNAFSTGSLTLADANKEGGSYSYKAITTNNTLASIGGGRVNLYVVSGAKVVNLDAKAYPDVVDVPTLNLASTVEINSGVEVSCVLNPDNNKTANVIFVNGSTT